jgi:hypothetical protein
LNTLKAVLFPLLEPPHTITPHLDPSGLASNSANFGIMSSTPLPPSYPPDLGPSIAGANTGYVTSQPQPISTALAAFSTLIASPLSSRHYGKKKLARGLAENNRRLRALRLKLPMWIHATGYFCERQQRLMIWCIGWIDAVFRWREVNITKGEV